MLERLFVEVLNMGITGSFVILAVLLLKIIMKKLPKRYSYCLWIIPFVRLVLPFSFESFLSLIPVNPEPVLQDIAYSAAPVINTGITVVDLSVNSLLPAADAAASVNPLQVILGIGTVIWITGLIGFIVFGIWSYYKVRKQLLTAKQESGNIYISENISTAFVLGIVNPRIFLPAGLEENEMEYILCHEQTHIRRADHIVRFMTYLVLGIHWFNPFVWIAFYLSGRDMEMACDEAVIEQLGIEVKGDYSQSLLNFSNRDYRLSVSPLAFGEGDTKGRIRNVLGYKKPKTYIAVAASAIIIVAALTLLSNPIDEIDISAPVNGFDLEDIYQYKTPYVGDNSSVGHIANGLPVLNENLTQKYISLITGDYNQLTIYYEPVADSVLNGGVPADAVSEEKLELNAMITFALIDNVDEIVFAVRNTPSEELEFAAYTVMDSYQREDFNARYGDLKAIGDDLELLQYTCNELTASEITGTE